MQGVFARNLQRAVNVAAGKDREWEWDLEEAQRNGRIRYQVHPSLDEARAFAARVRGNGALVVSYDIETFESASLDEDARDGFTDTRIRLVQFSVDGGGGIAFPWEGDYRRLAGEILRSPNVKCGHHVWLFDNRVLEACGQREGLDLRPRGTIHDTLQMFHHWQPDLPAHLQFAAQFVQFPFPWKHLAATNLEFYGCVDVDATLRLYEFLLGQLKRDGIYDSAYDVHGDCVGGYVGQMQQVRPILAAMERRGLPVDDAERLKLDGEFDLAQQELGGELWKRAPDACRRVHPKEGYKGVPPQVKALDFVLWGGSVAPFVLTDANGPILFKEPDSKKKDGTVEEGEWYVYQRRNFVTSTTIADDSTGEPCVKQETVDRWHRLYQFNPNSAPQLVAYMKAKGHKVPKSRETDDEGKEKDTTAKKELMRLAHRTGDDFYLRVIEYRELSKMRGTYIEGFKPHADGCCHPTFTFDTGTGQLAARNPNSTNFPKHVRLAKAIRRMIAAPIGQVLVETDYRSYHVLTTGYCAEDASYMRMARLDMHSFVAGCFTGAWKPQVIEESDDALLDRFRWFKTDPDRKRIRDKQAKPAILGVGFGMGARRLYQENLEHFSGEKTAKQFLDLLQHLFPKVFAWQKCIRQQAHDQTFLKSPFGHIRRFYEVFVWDYKSASYKNGDQAEEAVAFLPANCAFGNIRLAAKELQRQGLDEEFGLCNHIHDSWVWAFDSRRLDEFVERVIPVLTAPSKVLVNPTVAPNGLVVDVETQAGPNWAQMEDIPYAMASMAR
jgi:DNA polymerase family A